MMSSCQGQGQARRHCLTDEELHIRVGLECAYCFGRATLPPGMNHNTPTCFLQLAFQLVKDMQVLNNNECFLGQAQQVSQHRRCLDFARCVSDCCFDFMHFIFEYPYALPHSMSTGFDSNVPCLLEFESEEEHFGRLVVKPNSCRNRYLVARR